MDLGHWVTTLDPPESFFGFIYRITRLSDGKSYIGKKQARTIRKMKPLKGKKLKRHKEVETDWKTYRGSSPALNEDIEKDGEDGFKFEIIRFCDCKWELSYYEAEAQFSEKVLFFPDKFYNGIINLRINRPPKAVLEKWDKTLMKSEA